MPEDILNSTPMRYLVIYEENPDNLRFYIVDNPLPDTEKALDVLAGAPDFCREKAVWKEKETELEEAAFEIIFGEEGKYTSWTEATMKDLYECRPDYIVAVTLVL